jgi:hypothetical protein
MGRKRGALPIRGQAIPCAWCGEAVTSASTGRLPKWCSQACRQRAWVQRKAAGSGRAPVEVVERVVEVEVERVVERVVEVQVEVDREVRVVEQIEVPVTPRGPAWPVALHELVKQLNSGKLYDRDLLALAQALNDVLQALDRRPAWRRRRERR